MKKSKTTSQKDTFLVSPSYHKSSKFSVIFDDKKSASYAGLHLVNDFATKLQLIDLADQIIDLGDSPGRPNPGRKIMTLIESFIVGGDCIDDADVLRSGCSEMLVNHKVMAPSTLGTFLRSFTYGNVRQLDKLFSELLKRASGFGILPKNEDITLDVDSTICELYGKNKEGASYGYTKVLGLHPLIATLGKTGDIVHVRNRRGSAHSGRGSAYFITETINRLKNVGCTANITLRADSGFYSKNVIKACRDKGVNYSITAKLAGSVKRAIELIDESNFVEIDYTLNGEAYVGETTYGDNHRLIVRRTKITGDQADLFDNWQYHAFITDLKGDKVDLDAYHRNHATVELNIKDLKENVGLNHMPSGKFAANSAWLIISAMAYNFMIWMKRVSDNKRITAKSFRKMFILFAGRITKKARKYILHLPHKWPYQKQWIQTLDAIALLTIKT